MPRANLPPRSRSPKPTERTEPANNKGSESPKVLEILNGVIPSQRLSAEEMFALCRKWPSDSGSLYVYRLWPVIDRKLAGHDRNYIDIWIVDNKTQQFSEDYLLSTWGSGHYRLILSDGKRPKGFTQVAETRVKLDDPDRPPVIEDLRELVKEHRENRSYIAHLRAAGLMEGNVEGTTNAAVAGLVDLNKALMEHQQQADRKGNGITEMSAVVRDFATAAAAMQPKNPFDVGALLTALLAQQTQLLQSIVTSARPAAVETTSKDPIEQLKTLLELKDMLGGSGPARKGDDSWGQLAAQIPGILTGAAHVLDSFGRFRSGHVVRSPAPPAATVVVDDEENEEDGEETPNMLMPSPSEIQRFIRLTTAGLKAFQDGHSGRAFAASVSMTDPDLLDALRRLGEDQLLLVMQAQPEIWQTIADKESQVRTWIRDFLAAGGDATTEKAA